MGCNTIVRFQHARATGRGNTGPALSNPGGTESELIDHVAALAGAARDDRANLYTAHQLQLAVEALSRRPCTADLICDVLSACD